MVSEFSAVLRELTWLDYAALAWFAACQVGYGYWGGLRRKDEGSFVAAIFAQRAMWMQAMSVRDLRMSDMLILQSFNQMTGFFATTTVLTLGGLGALAFSGENARAALQSFPLIAETSINVWLVKLFVLIVLFISAFFKFVWAHRLNQYLAVAIGATPGPDSPNEAARHRQVRLATVLANRASINTYAGLHAYYFAIAALSWFVHAALFILATTLVVLALYRREHTSLSARAIRDAARRD